MITTDLELAKKELNKDRIIGIPTETVYGLAGNVFSEKAVKSIFELKQRPLYNPLIVHIKSAEFLSEVARDIPAAAWKLARECWPGPLTLVLKKQSHIPDLVTSGKDTVAIRVPNHPIALALLEQLKFPLAAPSANPFGSISPTTANHVQHYFQDHLNVILDGGDCKKGIESTIVGFVNEEAVIYRLGSLSIDRIEDIIGKVSYHTQSEDELPAAPGMLSKHYAPNTDTFVTDDVEGLILLHTGQRIGLLRFQYPFQNVPVSQQEILSKTGDLDEAAKNLYAALHRLDRLKLDLIIAEKLPDQGMGKTINDKLKRAAKQD